MRNRRVLCAAAAATLAFAGCGNEKRSSNTGASPDASSADAKPVAAPKSKVAFTAPADGATLGSKFTAKVKLTNFVIDPASVGKSPVPGKGHLHFRLDGGRFDVPGNSAGGDLAAKLGVDGKYSPAVAPAMTYTQIPPGKHRLEIYLANNNHTDTGVEAEVEFTVK
ncbi:MAG: hypothetical protein QOJ12_1875 [Thermoleophilales bacterium]|nr:hypothetical protein [Thermoleophilales bacterium]